MIRLTVYLMRAPLNNNQSKKQPIMGNTSLKIETGHNNKRDNHASEAYEEKFAVLRNITGCPKIVKSEKTGIELEEYDVRSPQQNALSYDIHLYKLRSSSYSKNIAVVFNHELIDEKQRRFLVRVQKMTARLHQIKDLTSVEALLVFQQALSGFSQIYHHSKIPFLISDRMIAVNYAGQIRVWANPNFAINAVEPECKLRTQNQMLLSLQQALQDHVAPEYQKIFHQCCNHFNQSYRLAEAKNKIGAMIGTINKKTAIQELIEKMKSRMETKSLTPIKKQPKPSQNKVEKLRKSDQQPENHHISYKNGQEKNLARQNGEKNKENGNKNKITISMKNQKDLSQQKQFHVRQGPNFTHRIFGNLKDKIIKEKSPISGGTQQQPRSPAFKENKFQRSKSPDIKGPYFHEKPQKTHLSHSQVMVSAASYSPIKNKANDINKAKTPVKLSNENKFDLYPLQQGKVHYLSDYQKLKKQNINNLNEMRAGNQDKSVEKKYCFKIIPRSEKLNEKDKPNLNPPTPIIIVKNSHQPINVDQPLKWEHHYPSPLKLKNKTENPTTNKKINFKHSLHNHQTQKKETTIEFNYKNERLPQEQETRKFSQYMRLEKPKTADISIHTYQ